MSEGGRYLTTVIPYHIIFLVTVSSFLYQRYLHALCLLKAIHSVGIALFTYFLSNYSGDKERAKDG